ncbi:hypothetical protein BJ973_000554 [Actinoplanes tereljensis]|uniref:Uncharacterized protein n=1 Tax=Paractinoplanes tereljensis TaxID=571912 RepID=A0A919TU00_9ACTN|nr:hypothetical protein [Actinoplanes tereljensis]GIF23088.1 hypothetical protein Ate02nite_58180 [Actinoplanes tereljensis]
MSVSPFLVRIVECLPDCPAIVFSEFGEVLLRREAGPGRYRQVLVDPVARQVLLIFMN